MSSIANEKKLSMLSALSLDQLAELHMLLTQYIVATQRAKFREANHIAKTIASRFGIEIYTVLQADEIRREVHRLLKERAIKEARLNDTKLIIKEPFAIPDIEAIALSLSDRIKFGKIVVSKSNILIEQQEIEHHRIYGEPVGRGLIIDISYLRNAIKISGEIYGVLGEDIDYEYVFKDLSLREVRNLIEKGEIDVERICREEELEGYTDKPACTLLKKVLNNDFEVEMSYMFMKMNRCLNAAIMCFSLKNGEYLNVIPADSYTMAILWRELGDEAIRFPLVDVLSRLGLDAYVDRIYHEYPAEYDAGAESRSIVHIEFEKFIHIDSPEDEVRAVKEIEKILRKIVELWT